MGEFCTTLTPPPPPPYVPPGGHPGDLWETAFFSGELIYIEPNIYAHDAIVYTRKTLGIGLLYPVIGNNRASWILGRASKEFIAEATKNDMRVPLGTVFGRFDVSFKEVYASVVQPGIYQRMFLLAPEERQVTPYTLMAKNDPFIVEPWYREYLNLGY